MKLLDELHELSEEAKPRQEMHFSGRDFPMGRDDWGSQRQVDAENALGDFVAELIGQDAYDTFVANTLKHTTDELIAEMVRLATEAIERKTQ